MARSERRQDLDCDAYYDFRTDTVFIKVRRVTRNEDGRLCKRGIMFRVTEEMLQTIAEGQEYIVTTPDRWERLTEEVLDSE